MTDAKEPEFIESLLHSEECGRSLLYDVYENEVCSIAEIVNHIDTLRAERDALREEVVRLTDLATLSGEVFAFAITDAKMPNLETRRQLHDAVKRALDAAMAVQPKTEDIK